MKTIKTYKINVSSYLSIDTVDALDMFAHKNNLSRNSVIEKAVLNFLAKTNREKSQ